MIKIFLIFSLSILWLPNISANDLPTPRWVTSKNTINCRASYITDEDGKAMGSIKYQYVKKYFPWEVVRNIDDLWVCLLYTSPSPRDLSTSRMPSSA